MSEVHTEIFFCDKCNKPIIDDVCECPKQFKTIVLSIFIKAESEIDAKNKLSAMSKDEIIKLLEQTSAC